MLNRTLLLINVLRSFKHDERGVTSIEYGILAAGVAVVVGALVASDGAFSTTLNQLFTSIVEQLPQSSTSN